ncbi:unnamed protein product [Cunninghamella blakesleeana]
MILNKNDPSTFNHQLVTANGIQYEYIDENSSSKKPILLIHGWPNLWLGWREQIPFLVELGYRVIAVNLRGFGNTYSPADKDEYGFGVVSKDLVNLLDYLQIPTVTVLAHDWGGMAAWRFAQFYPERVTAVGSFCTPYSPPSQQYIPLEAIVKVLPNFTYQLYLNTPEAEKELNENAYNFFARVFRPIGDMKASLVDKELKTLVAGRPVLPKHDVISDKVLQYYADTYTKHGFRGPLNWYKQTENNYKQCKDLNPIISHPALMVVASNDAALPPHMSEGMEEYIPNLEKHFVDNSGHWILWEQPEKCNAILKSWLGKVYPTSDAKM